jgi:putative transcriptional regulator
MGSVLRASPLLIAPSSPNGDLQDGVLYLRFGVPLMTCNTLHDHLLEDVPPLIFHGPGGHYVSLDGASIRNKREILGFSLGALAEATGVSRKAIQMYESGMGSTVEIGLKLEEILGEQLIEPLDPFSYSEELQQIRDSLEGLEGIKKRVFDHLDSIGMEVIPTISCPFDALAISSDSRLLASVEKTLSSVRDRSETLSGICRMTDSRSVIIVGGKPRDKNIGGSAVLTISEVERSSRPDDVIRMVKERSGDE